MKGALKKKVMCPLFAACEPSSDYHSFGRTSEVQGEEIIQRGFDGEDWGQRRRDERKEKLLLCFSGLECTPKNKLKTFKITRYVCV